ncbi:MAG: anion transporter [Acidobacteria bacterium]|nr:MAG: anion transporter [Acidobacteriota bacterium]PYU44399.1 MAG: anion transporter [Acidobacteriota bacterium]PYU69720.1 MAG: anion transporter [Acidobacteriota bacterium]
MPGRYSGLPGCTPEAKMCDSLGAVMSELAILGTYSVFLASYVVFALGKFPGMKIDRPGAAIIGAVLMFMTGAVRVENSLRLIHFGTIVLLFSMMLVVAYLHLAGFFDWVTELVVTQLKPHHLLPTVIFLSGLLSAFFVNDIICLVMVPFVLKVTGRMGIKPIPYLLAVATASNIGSTATITGNPQNMLIGSFSDIGYRDFLWHLGPVALAGLFLDWFVLWWLYFRGQVHDVRTEPVVNAVQIEHAALLKAGIVAALVLAGFLAGFSPALVASVGAAVLLITRTRDPHLVYDEVDWGLLVFFVGLFLIVGGAENAGLTRHLLGFGERFNLQHLGVFTLVTAILSNLVSNVPAVMLLKSLVSQFANTHSAWLTLAMASTLAGNLTITGSVANIIVVERAQKEAVITFLDYFRIGLPVTLLTLLVGWLWLSWIR